MDKLELMKTFYDSARTELIERIQLRDNALLLYLGAMGALFGATLSALIASEVLLVSPFIALGAAIIICQHNAVIGALASYCATEIQAYLDEIMPNEGPTQWENSASLKEYHQRSTDLRSIGHAILIVIPAIAALAVNWRHALYSPFPNGILWWSGALCVGVSMWLIRLVHSWRTRLYMRRKW